MSLGLYSEGITFEVPLLVEDAGVEILRISESPTGRTGDSPARIRYLCCDRDGVMSLHNIERRARMGTVLCKSCTAKAETKQKAPYGVTPPTWPVPGRK